MMKIKTAHWQWTAFLCVLLAVSVTFAGCAAKAYACEIITETSTSVEDKPEELVRTVHIGKKDFECTYSESRRLDATGEIYYTYTVKQPGENDTGYIHFSKAGELLFFMGICPFETIENWNTLSDSELKETVENLLGNMVDFSKYNTFYVQRPYSINKCRLVWEVKREITCAISLDIEIDENGNIDFFDISDECADDFYAPFVTGEDRDALIWETLRDRKSSLVPYKFEILSEVLGMHEGKNALCYTLGVTDKDGFCESVVLVITQN